MSIGALFPDATKKIWLLFSEMTGFVKMPGNWLCKASVRSGRLVVIKAWRAPKFRSATLKAL